MRRRIYLTLERGRDIALRNLLRKVFIAGGYEGGKDGGEKIRRTRIPLDEFVAAVRLGSSADGNRVESDEVECLLANMIYKVRLPPSFFLLHHFYFLLYPPKPSPSPPLNFSLLRLFKCTFASYIGPTPASCYVWLMPYPSNY